MAILTEHLKYAEFGITVNEIISAEVNIGYLLRKGEAKLVLAALNVVAYEGYFGSMLIFLFVVSLLF